VKRCRAHLTRPHAGAAGQSRPYRGSGRQGTREAALGVEGAGTRQAPMFMGHNRGPSSDSRRRRAAPSFRRGRQRQDRLPDLCRLPGRRPTPGRAGSGAHVPNGSLHPDGRPRPGSPRRRNPGRNLGRCHFQHVRRDVVFEVDFCAREVGRVALEGAPGHLSYVDRQGAFHAPFDEALELAKAFCAAEPSTVLVGVEATEGKWSQQASRPDGEYVVSLLNEYRAAWALIRQWTGHALPSPCAKHGFNTSNAWSGTPSMRSRKPATTAKPTASAGRLRKDRPR